MYKHPFLTVLYFHDFTIIFSTDTNKVFSDAEQSYRDLKDLDMLADILS